MKPIIRIENPPAGAIPATVEQLQALGFAPAEIDAGGKQFEFVPHHRPNRVRAIVERAEWGKDQHGVNTGKAWVEFYPIRTLTDTRENGYALDGRVSLNGRKLSAFTSDILFELPDGRLISAAVIFARDTTKHPK
jgi:hypothetical protein